MDYTEKQTIEITSRDLQEAFINSVGDIYVFPQDDIEIDVYPINSDLEFIPERKDLIACYYPSTNKIRIGGRSIELSEGFLLACLRHEKSHFIFGNLPEEPKAKIVESFFTNHYSLINDYYQLLRKNYSLSYFKHGTLKYSVVEANGEIEFIDGERVINELLAFSVTPGSGGEELLDWQGLFPTLDTAVKILDTVREKDPDLYAELELYGFRYIEGRAILEKFKNSNAYAQYQKLRADKSSKI